MTDNKHHSATKEGWAGHVYLWLAYLMLAIILTWPTIAHVATQLPGDGGDDPALAWNLWWVKFALLNQGRTPFLTDYMFYPLGINLAFYTLTLLNGLTALPLLLNFGVVAASNLQMLFTFTVGAYGAFLLTRYLLATSWPAANSGQPKSSLIWLSAAIAGGFYAFASSKLFYVALGQFNIASNHWIPLAVLYVLRTRRDPARLKNPILAGLFLVLQSWAEIFDSADPPSIEFRLLERRTGDTLAIHLVEESIRPGSTAGEPASTVLATNTYLLHHGEWHMLSHHSSLPLVKGSRTRSRRTMH